MKSIDNISDLEVKSIVDTDIKAFSNMILFNSFSNPINYMTNIEAIKLLEYSNAIGYFFFVSPRKDKSLLQEYNLISKKFNYLQERVWFLYSVEEEENSLNHKESNKIKLYYYDNYGLFGQSTYFFFDEDINYHYIHTFFTKKINYENLAKIYDSKNKLMDIFEYKSDLVFSKYFIIYFYNVKQNEEKNATFRKWIYMLEKTNFLINNENFTKIQFFKYDFSNNKELINLPNNILKESPNKIYLYTKKSNKNQIEYNNIQYEGGPSLQYFENFLQQNVLLMKIKIDQEEHQKFFEEIFYNEELIDIESELDSEFSEFDEL